MVQDKTRKTGHTGNPLETKKDKKKRMETIEKMARPRKETSGKTLVPTSLRQDRMERRGRSSRLIKFENVAIVV